MARLLVCEDDPDIRFFLKTQLEAAGHEVVEADNGDAGFGEYVHLGVDMILTDMMMPDFSGADLVSTLTLIDNSPPVLVISAFTDDARTQALEKEPNVVGVLSKPWDRDELLGIIATHTGTDAAS